MSSRRRRKYIVTYVVACSYVLTSHMIEVDEWKRRQQGQCFLFPPLTTITPRTCCHFGKEEEMREVVILLFDHQTAVVIVGTTGKMRFDVILWGCCQKI